MRKNVKYVIVSSVVLAALICVICLLSFLPTDFKREIDNGYYVSTYSTDAIVMQDNTVLVSETISVRFRENRFGFVRALPLQSVVNYSENGKEKRESYALNYSNIEVKGANIKRTFRQGNNLCLEIGGNSPLNVEESYVYVINYILNFGNDRFPNYDLFHLNIVDNSWNTTVSNVSFKVEFFEDISSYYNNVNYGAVVNYKTTDGERNVAPNLINNSTLSFMHSGSLAAFEGLSLSVKLAENFFDNAENLAFDIVALILAILAIVIVILLFFVFGNRHRVKKASQFYEPKGYNSAEARFVLTNKIDNRAAASLILLWISGGFVALSEVDGKTILFKQCDIIDAKKYEKELFSQIFDNKDSVDLDEVKLKIKNAESYKTQATKECNSLVLQKKSLIAMWIVALLPILALGVSMFCSMRHTGAGIEYRVSFALGVVILTSVCYSMVILKNRYTFKKSRFVIFAISLTVLILVCLITVFLLTFKPTCDVYFTTLISVIAVMLAYIALLLWSPYSRRGAALASASLGLHDFIKNSSPVELENQDNAQLFNKILPYAYALNLDDIWCEKFAESVEIKDKNLRNLVKELNKE